MKSTDDIVAGFNEIADQAASLSNKSASLSRLRLMESGEDEENLKDVEEAKKRVDELSRLSSDLQNQIDSVSDLLRRYK